MYGGVALGKFAHIRSPEFQRKGGVHRVVILVPAWPVLVLPAAVLAVAFALAFILIDF